MHIAGSSNGRTSPSGGEYLGSNPGPAAMDSKEKMWAEIRPTGRSAEEYFRELGIPKEFLRGKKILDIGSGLNQFAQDLKPENLDLTSIDAFYALTPEQREEVFEDLTPDNFKILKKDLERITAEEKDSHLVGGRAESLPFQDEVFDVVLAEYSMPHYAESFEQMREFFFEVARVLKSGGEARIYPMRIRPGSEVEERDIDKILSELRSQGFTTEMLESKDLEYRMERNNGLLIIRRP